MNRVDTPAVRVALSGRLPAEGSGGPPAEGRLAPGPTSPAPPPQPWMVPLPPGPVRWVPAIPESAPFTPEQRAWLNGFLAGLFSRVPVPDSAGEPAGPGLLPLTVLYGSQTGNAERLARRVAKEAGSCGFAVNVQELNAYELTGLPQERYLLVLTSTYGDGEPPDNARAFWTRLAQAQLPSLRNLHFSVCALGDRNYPRFCQFGRDLDARLEQLGAVRLHPRQDCDVDFEEAFGRWLSGVLAALTRARSAMSIPASSHGPEVPKGEIITGGQKSEAQSSPRWSRKNPFPARLRANRKLTGDGSTVEVRHFALSLEGSGLDYEPGDALGVWPQNPPSLVEEILEWLGTDGGEEVEGRPGEPMPLRRALLHHLDLHRVSDGLLTALAERSGDAAFHADLRAGGVEGLRPSLNGCQIVDLLQRWPQARLPAREFASLLRPLQPRLYSIASSPLVHPTEVHLTVRIVRYERQGRPREGVCSTFLADRVGPDTPVPVFVHKNPGFRLPPADAPLIMIGPGTGIAPFRAFLQHRRATGARGKNWLFFGGRHEATDFLYREELLEFRQQGYLDRLDLAWSRDQAHKIYVQHRMLEHAAELWRWLNEGAYLYVCGDASRMAPDVEAALQQIFLSAGGLDADQAVAYLDRLRVERRYCRDVY